MSKFIIPTFTLEDFRKLMLNLDFEFQEDAELGTDKYWIMSRKTRYPKPLGTWQRDNTTLTVFGPEDNELMDWVKKNHKSFAPSFWDKLFQKVTWENIFQKV